MLYAGMKEYMKIYVYTYTNIWDVFWVYNYDDQFLDVSREGVFIAYIYICICIYIYIARKFLQPLSAVVRRSFLNLPGFPFESLDLVLLKLCGITDGYF